MRRFAVILAAALLAPASLAAAQDRPRWDTKVLAIVPPPGFPAHAYVHPDGTIYAGTYTNPGGDSSPSRVFEYSASGTMTRSWTILGQDLSKAHGVQAATSDAEGRLVLLDKSPPRALLLDRGTGEQSLYAAFPDGAIPNYAAWGPDGSLYVTDYGNPTIWRIPPRGGTPEAWLTDPRFEGAEFGLTGLVLAADRSTLLVAIQSEAGGAAGNPSTGRLWAVPIGGDGKPGPLRQVWESRPVDGPDGFAIAKSGRVYITNLVSNQIAVVEPDGRESERFPAEAFSGDNGSSVPFDGLSSVRFLGGRLIAAAQSYINADPNHWALFDVQVGEEGLPELIPGRPGTPPSAGGAPAGRDTTRPRITRVSIRGRRLRLRLSERATVTVRIDGKRRVRRTLAAGTRTVKLPSLRRGRHRLTIVAVDLAGNRSTTVRRTTRGRARR